MPSLVPSPWGEGKGGVFVQEVYSHIVLRLSGAVIMNSSVFEKVLLSAIFTSCTVFSVLTLAFLPHRAEPPLNESIAGESIEDINHRNVIIRHIGMSIALSVGAGITTAELIRKRRRLRAIAPDGRQVLSAQSTLQAVDLPDMAIDVNGRAASLQVLTNGMSSVDRPEFQTHATPVLESDQDTDWEDTALPPSLFQPSVSLPTEAVNWFPLTQLDDALPTLLELMQTADWSRTGRLIVSREQYQTCRIRQLNAPERLFAILFEGQYYRFVKVAIDHKQALRIFTRLNQRSELVVITHTEERYIVWALVPDACPEVTALSGADSATCFCTGHLAA